MNFTIKRENTKILDTTMEKAPRVSIDKPFFSLSLLFGMSTNVIISD